MDIATTSYRVCLQQFEGPLDLLLHLVREAKLDITEISLARVAEQYFAYLESMQQLNIELESSYLVVFAQLLELKSRLLLPYEGFTDAGEEVAGSGDDNCELELAPSLVEKLSEYALIKEASEWLSVREDEAGASYHRTPVQVLDFAPELEVSLPVLVRAMRRLQRTAQAKQSNMTVAKVALSVPQRVEELKQILAQHRVVKFSFLLGKNPSREWVIVNFLALLELVSQHRAVLEQEQVVGEIVVTQVAKQAVGM